MTSNSRDILKKEKYLNHSDSRFWHGRLVPSTAKLETPKKTYSSELSPRDDHNAPDWLTASEYQDTPGVMRFKMERLAHLLTESKKTVVYSGAGISVAAGVHQAARGSGGHRQNRSTTAQPTITHYALSALAQRGLVHGWVQQNHDGLPQKAGFPQEGVNEVHGSWYDPSNPVVKYSGTLRDHECDWMVNEAQTADLALVLGTSLGGLNADQVATTPAYRSRRGHALGMVMINLQQTEQDGKASLRIFGKSDDVLLGVLNILGVSCPTTTPTPPVERRVLIPYDKDGRRSNRVRMWLDLRPGAAIQLSPGHNIEGAQQPAYNHMATTKQPCGKVICWKDSTMGIHLNMEGVNMLLGQWWLTAAARGGPETIPVVNVSPEIVVVSGQQGSRPLQLAN